MSTVIKVTVVGEQHNNVMQGINLCKAGYTFVQEAQGHAFCTDKGLVLSDGAATALLGLYYDTDIEVAPYIEIDWDDKRVTNTVNNVVYQYEYLEAAPISNVLLSKTIRGYEVSLVSTSKEGIGSVVVDGHATDIFTIHGDGTYEMYGVPYLSLETLMEYIEPSIDREW